MNDNRFREPLDKRCREKLAELEALVDEARDAQAQCSIITARIAGVTAEIAALGQISGSPPVLLTEPLDRGAWPYCPHCNRRWSGDAGDLRPGMQLCCRGGCERIWDFKAPVQHDGEPCRDRIWSEVGGGGGSSSGAGITGITAR